MAILDGTYNISWLNDYANSHLKLNGKMTIKRGSKDTLSGSGGSIEFKGQQGCPGPSGLEGSIGIQGVEGSIGISCDTRSQGVTSVDGTCGYVTLRRSIPAEDIEEAVLQILEKYGIYKKDNLNNLKI